MAFSLAGGEILLSYADAAVTKLMSKVWSSWLTEARFFFMPICDMLVLSDVHLISKYSNILKTFVSEQTNQPKIKIQALLHDAHLKPSAILSSSSKTQEFLSLTALCCLPLILSDQYSA